MLASAQGMLQEPRFEIPRAVAHSTAAEPEPSGRQGNCGRKLGACVIAFLIVAAQPLELASHPTQRRADTRAGGCRKVFEVHGSLGIPGEFAASGSGGAH